MSHKISIALVQHEMTNEPKANIELSLELTKQAVSQDADLVILPELHRTPYFCKSQDPKFFDEAEPLKGPTFQALSQAAKSHGIVIVGSIFESRQAGLASNTAIVVDQDGEMAGFYRKMHIPDDPGYNEKFYFAPGDTGFTPIDTSIGRLGVCVCWDQWFPEAARLMALAGADVLIYPTAIGWDPQDDVHEQERQLNAWRVMHQAHAIANGLPVVSCNRVGYELDPNDNQHPAQCWGHSLLIGQQGETLAEGGEISEVICAPVDLDRTKEVRRMWPFLRDRRIDAYEGLLARSIEDKS